MNEAFAKALVKAQQEMPTRTKEGLPRQRLYGVPIISRLLFRTQISEDGCWIWRGGTNPDGYGTMKGDRSTANRSTHRVSYEHFVGPIPEGLELDHLCRVRRCVNPAHLELVDHATNVRRGAAYRRVAA